MAKNKDLFLALKSLQNSISGLDFYDAIKIMDEKIASSTINFRPHFELKKADFLWFSNQREASVEYLVSCTQKYPTECALYYSLGEHQVELGNFAEAIPYLSQCLEISKKSDDIWYEDSAIVLRAYCNMKQHNYTASRDDLLRLTEEIAMPWLKCEPAVSRVAIKEIVG
jgi:tetratricopeptide (TPR) repeat protein